MAIEFRCSRCEKLLRVADDTAGKQAKCPSCEAVVQIPLPSAPGNPLIANPFPALDSSSAPATTPFAPNVQPMPPVSDGGFNPYQAPSSGLDPSVTGYSAFGAPTDNASRGARLAAAMLDGFVYLLVLIPAFVLAVAFEMVNKPPEDTLGAVFFLAFFGFLFVVLTVQWVLLSQRGQTIGKIALGIRIVNIATGDNPGFVGAVILRKWVPLLICFVPCVGGIFAWANVLWIFGDESRCLHDHIAQTRVIIVPR